MKFYHRINIFLGLRGTQKITSFHVQCNSSHCCCSHYVEEWISEIVARRVEQVNISLRTSHRSDLNLHELFTCTTIVNLKIEGPFELSIPYIIVLPNVKSLHIKVKVCYAVKNICNLICQSQAFELFYLKYCLAELTLVRNSRYIRLINRNQLYDIDLQYDYDYISDIMRIHRWLRINKAKVYLTVHFDMGETFSHFLHGIPHVECLSLKYCSGDIHPSMLDLPLFKNIIELRLFVKKDDSLIMELPARCPKLRVLEVNNLDDRQRSLHTISVCSLFSEACRLIEVNIKGQFT
ncbi:hypothetical protein Fmac_010407 [Flemingia macrophylla]|uniref:Uncharacterized protein n=1 Tax=Flemingia macrophylla TaxID=520843 RepID=A0ABD1MJH5_9FABA